MSSGESQLAKLPRTVTRRVVAEDTPVEEDVELVCVFRREDLCGSGIEEAHA
jgi:hypothetical protein